MTFILFGLVYHGINSDQLGCDMTADLVDLISQQVKQDLGIFRSESLYEGVIQPILVPARQQLRGLAQVYM